MMEVLAGASAKLVASYLATSSLRVIRRELRRRYPVIDWRPTDFSLDFRTVKPPQWRRPQAPGAKPRFRLDTGHRVGLSIVRRDVTVGGDVGGVMKEGKDSGELGRFITSGDEQETLMHSLRKRTHATSFCGRFLLN